MGSWNGTCSVTSLPILEGEEVYLMLASDTGLSSIGYSYDPQDSCRILTPPLLGQYCDYGNYHFLAKKHSNNLYKFVLEKCVDRDGEPFPSIDEDILDELLHDDSVYIKAPYDTTLHSVNFLPVVRNVFERMVYTRFGTNKQKQSIKKGILESIIKADDKLNEELSIALDEKDERFSKTIHEMTYNPEKHFQNNKLYCKLPRDMTHFKFKEYLNAYIDLAGFESACNSLRIKLGNNSGLGSQHDGFEDHIEFHEAAIEYCKKLIKERDDNE